MSNSQKHKNFILKSDYLQNSYNNNSSVHKSNATNNSCSNLEQKSVGEIHNESPHFQNNSGNCNFNINICNNNITNIINKTENNIAMTPNETKTNKQQIISKNSNTTTTSFKATISNIDKNVHSQFIKSRFGEFNTNIPPQQINLIGNNKQPKGLVIQNPLIQENSEKIIIINNNDTEIPPNIPSPSLPLKQGNIKQNNLQKKANMIQNFSYNQNDIINNSYFFCKEQFGCRLLQKIIDDNPNYASEVFYPKIRDKFTEISCELFGNYFIQKLLDYLKMSDLEEIVQRIIPNSFRNICLNQHGTRVIQKLLACIQLNENLMNFFILLVTPYMNDFIFDQNASHIVSKFVECTVSPKNDFVIEFLAKNIYEIVTQKHSCCALQKCIQSSNPIQRKILLHSIANRSYRMFNNQYGNYVIQYVITLCDFEINHILVLNLLSDFQTFSSMKYSSSIIEKCMQLSDKKSINLIFDKLCNDCTLVERMLFDMYGNYVIQRALSIAKEPYRTRLYEFIAPKLDSLRFLSFGNKLYNKLITTYPEIIMYIPNYHGNNNNQMNNNLMTCDQMNFGPVKRNQVFCKNNNQNVNNIIDYTNPFQFGGNNQTSVNMNNFGKFNNQNNVNNAIYYKTNGFVNRPFM